MTQDRTYAVVLEPEAGGGFSVHIPAFRGAHIQGETVDECLANARDVIELHAEIMTERGEPLPPSDEAKTERVAPRISWSTRTGEEPVHIHSGRAIKRGTLAAILDDADMSPDELRALL